MNDGRVAVYTYPNTGDSEYNFSISKIAPVFSNFFPIFLFFLIISVFCYFYIIYLVYMYFD